MIIWGWRGVESTKGTGRFYCPSCNAERDYRHRAIRRYFTLYFLPVVPLSKVGEYIECQTCRKQFMVEVLEHDPRKQEQAVREAFGEAVAEVMIGAASVGGPRSASTIASLRSALASQIGRELSIHELKSRMGDPPREPADAIAGVIDAINEQGKEILFRSALLGASIDRDELDEPAQRYVLGLAEAMHMSPAHVKGILSEGEGEDE